MRCNECNKFVPTNSETDVQDMDLEVSDDGIVSGSCSIANECEECGTELQTAGLDLESAEPAFTAEEIAKHKVERPDCDAELEVEHDDGQRTEGFRFEGKGRGARHYYGVEVIVTVKCQCEDPKVRLEAEITLTAEVQSSDMEEA